MAKQYKFVSPTTNASDVLSTYAEVCKSLGYDATVGERTVTVSKDKVNFAVLVYVVERCYITFPWVSLLKNRNEVYHDLKVVQDLLWWGQDWRKQDTFDSVKRTLEREGIYSLDTNGSFRYRTVTPRDNKTWTINTVAKQLAPAAAVVDDIKACVKSTGKFSLNVEKIKLTKRIIADIKEYGWELDKEGTEIVIGSSLVIKSLSLTKGSIQRTYSFDGKLFGAAAQEPVEWMGNWGAVSYNESIALGAKVTLDELPNKEEILGGFYSKAREDGSLEDLDYVISEGSHLNCVGVSGKSYSVYNSTNTQRKSYNKEEVVNIKDNYEAVIKGIVDTFTE